MFLGFWFFLDFDKKKLAKQRGDLVWYLDLKLKSANKGGGLSMVYTVIIIVPILREIYS